MKARPKVLIVAHQNAREIDGVIDLLRDWDVAIERWNLCQYPEAWPLSFISPSNEHSGNSLSATTCDSGWIHDPGFFTVTRSLDGLPREVSLKECNAFWEGILLNARLEWLNEPLCIRKASNKVYQLHLAETHGIQVPNSVVTNDPAVAREFISRNERVVVKTLGASYFIDGKSNIKFYTQRVQRPLEALCDALRFAPVILQTEIDKKEEVRVTVVDDKCFSVRIDCENLDPAIVDIRQIDFAKNRERFSAAQDLHELEGRSRQLVKFLGISYAGLDWVISHNGEPYFLECNPLASFKWYELCSGHDITRAIAHALAERATLRYAQS